MSATYEDGQKSAFLNQSIASKAVLWWDAKDPSKPDCGNPRSRCLRRFSAKWCRIPVPVDMRALKALKKSPGLGHLLLADLPGQLRQAA